MRVEASEPNLRVGPEISTVPVERFGEPLRATCPLRGTGASPEEGRARGFERDRAKPRRCLWREALADRPLLLCVELQTEMRKANEMAPRREVTFAGQRGYVGA